MRRRVLIPIKTELDSSEQFHFSQSVSVDFDTEEYIGIFITRNDEFDRIGSKMIKAPNASLSIYGSEYIKGMKNFWVKNLTLFGTWVAKCMTIFLNGIWIRTIANLKHFLT